MLHVLWMQCVRVVLAWILFASHQGLAPASHRFVIPIPIVQIISALELIIVLDQNKCVVQMEIAQFLWEEIIIAENYLTDRYAALTACVHLELAHSIIQVEVRLSYVVVLVLRKYMHLVIIIAVGK